MKYGTLLGIRTLTKLMISHVRFFMIISHVKIIAFQTIINHCLWIFYNARKDCSLYNKQNNICVLGNTRNKTALKRNLIFLCTMYYTE